MAKKNNKTNYDFPTMKKVQEVKRMEARLFDLIEQEKSVDITERYSLKKQIDYLQNQYSRIVI